MAAMAEDASISRDALLSDMPATHDVLVHSPVLDLLEEAFVDPTVTGAINEFCVQHAAEFKPIGEGEEHPLEYHQVYLQYCDMLESKVEAFVAQQNVTVEDIIEAARHAPPGVHTCVDYLLASTEYESFLMLMLDFNAMNEYVCEDE